MGRDGRLSLATFSRSPSPFNYRPHPSPLSNTSTSASRLEMTSSPLLCLLSPPTLSLRNPSLSFSSCLHLPQLFSSGIGFAGKVRNQYQLGRPSARCNAIPKARLMQVQEALPNGLSVIERLDALPEGDEEEREESLAKKVSEVDEIRCRVDVIRDMLNSMGDGEVSVSAYDTAWVALVKDVDGSGAPQFPSSLQWIQENQLSDGSWGDRHLFLAHDRIINTLACVIALKSWNVFPERCDRGMAFIKENMGKLEDEIAEHMPIGFEITFPSLIGIARSLGLELSFDSPVLEDIHAKRNLKLSRIPKEMMHKMPTTLLYSLEGLPDLDWEKLLKLQNQNGSFLFSPSSTAFALMETKDQKCLDYIRRVVERFKGGVPGSYPIDMFEHIWAVDRLERLGISRYFELEIKTCLDYVFRNWSEDGIAWARNSRVVDVDDTAMGFRILRLHGYQVSADVLAHFEKGGEYFCFVGQSNQAVTGIFNLYRASQVMLPGEKILEDAKRFSCKFLTEKQASGQLLDKWIITKDLPGEVRYALDFPWYASLPRVETRIYLQQYGGEDDVWIGKTLYRMPYVNNNLYLDLAKHDFNNCQELHQLEWLQMQKWYYECSLGEYGLSKISVLRAYFLAAASIFEPGKATERLAWARTAALLEALSSYLGNGPCTTDCRRAFLNDFVLHVGSGSKKTGKGLVGALLQSLRHLSWEALLAHGRDVRYHLNQAWEEWLRGQWQEGEGSGEAELLVRTINLCAGRWVPEEVLSHPNYRRLTCATNKVCRQLRRLRETQNHRFYKGKIATRMINHSIEEGMQEIVQGVLQSSDGIDSDIKQTFLIVAKSFYYYTHCSPATFNIHIAKVLFERVA